MLTRSVHLGLVDAHCTLHVLSEDDFPINILIDINNILLGRVLTSLTSLPFSFSTSFPHMLSLLCK